MKTKRLKLTDFNEYTRNRLGETEYATLQKEAQLEAMIYRSLQQQFAHAVQTYMQRENKGFNDLVTHFGLSQTQVNKILKGTGNFTLSTLAHVFAVMGAEPKLL